MAEQYEYLVAEQLEIDSFDCLKPVRIRFAKVADPDSLVLELLMEDVALDALIALLVHVRCLELQGLLDKPVLALLIVLGSDLRGAHLLSLLTRR